MYKYEIREIDAWAEDEGFWSWNSSYKIGEFESKNPTKRAFLRALHKLGIFCNRGVCRVVDDGDFWELQNRKTGEPLIAAVPLNF